MKPTNVLRMLGGSIAVYLIMAACSGAGSTGIADGDGGATHAHDASHGDDGSSLVDGSGVADAVLDAIMNPVGDAKADVNVSGSRLKAKNYAGADGSKQFFGWRDTQRNEDCAFSTAADGVPRCLPSGIYVSPNYFSDAACSQHLAFATTKGCAAGNYAVATPPSSTCNEYRTHVYTTQPFNGAQVYSGNGTTCTGSSAAGLVMSFDLYAVGAEVDPASFVAATIQIDP